MKDNFSAAGHQSVVSAYKHSFEACIASLCVSQVLDIDSWETGSLRKGAGGGIEGRGGAIGVSMCTGTSETEKMSLPVVK